MQKHHNGKEQMFVQMCEGLHESEAQLLVDAKDKKLHQVYKGLSTNVVREAFNWTEDFMAETPETYPQANWFCIWCVGNIMSAETIEKLSDKIEKLESRIEQLYKELTIIHQRIMIYKNL